MLDHFRTIIPDVPDDLAGQVVESARGGGAFADFAGALRGQTLHSDADLRAAFAAALLDQGSSTLTPRQAQAMFDALQVQALRWDCPDDGCHARAFLMCDELLPAWGVPQAAIGRAWLFSMHPAGWGFEVEDRSGRLHTWSEHTASTVEVQSQVEPTVLDPTLFGGPVSLPTWMGRFHMPGTSAAGHSATPPPVPGALRHYLDRILQGGQSAFNQLSPEVRKSLWADRDARQRLLAAGLPPPAEPAVPEVQPPRLVSFAHDLTETYQGAYTRLSRQGVDGVVIHTGFRRGAFSDVPWATVAHQDFRW